MIVSVIRIVFISTFTLAAFTLGCSAQTEDQALATIRQSVRDGRTLSEAYVAGIESRFAGRRAGLLAKLLRAKIKFDNRDFAGAAALLNTEEFRLKTKVADHAAWLRGLALQESGNHSGAMQVFESLITLYPDSLHVTASRLKWAGSAIRTGQAARVPAWLADLSNARNAGADLLIAQAYDAQGNPTEALRYYRRVYFYGAGTDAAKQAEATLVSLSQPLTPQSADEALQRADLLLGAKDFSGAEKAFGTLSASYPTTMTAAVRLRQLTALSGLKKGLEAQSAFNAIPAAATEKEESYYHLTMAYARGRQWPQARATAEEMRTKYPLGKLTPKAWVDAGMAARDAKNKLEEQILLRAAVAHFPNAVEVAGAQFELAWLEHERGDYAASSRMLTEHLARYAQRDTTNRGKAGYWAARDSERAGRTA